MNEKLVAGLVTAAGVGPLCAVCVLGLAAVGAALAGAFAWLGGAGPLLVVALMVAAGLLAYRTVRRRRQRSRPPSEDRPTPHLLTMEDSKLGAAKTASGVRSAKQGERT